jgi:transcriptional regulator with XRE-family HTH domain
LAFSARSYYQNLRTLTYRCYNTSVATGGRREALMTEVETPPLRVRELRKQRKLTQTQLAYLAGSNAGTISHLEHGNHIPNLRFLARVAAALGVEVRDLFVSEESPDVDPQPPAKRGEGFDAGEVLARGAEAGEKPGGLGAVMARTVERAVEHADARLRHLEEMRARIALAREILAQEAENDELRKRRDARANDEERKRREALAADLEADAAELEAEAAEIGGVVHELRAQSA